MLRNGRLRFVGWLGWKAKERTATLVITLLGCWLLGLLLHKPIPRTHDEFSYALMGETIASGHVANTAPPLSEFFDSFHVLVRPVHASKYFSAQGIFLALGQRLTGHPAAGLWFSSALACAAITWMLQAWLSPGWSLLGGFLFLVQYGVFSYWSQTYWGGMVPALGGALFLGAAHGLWDEFSWKRTTWLALGLLILANSRPLEGALVVVPAGALFFRRLWQTQRWRGAGLWVQFIVPLVVVLAPGIAAMGLYNRVITGSALKTPYSLHEEQYQESSPFLFLPPRQQLTYSSFWLRQYYHVQEFQQHYLAERKPKVLPMAAGRKIATWWDFYCGVLLSIPLFLTPLLRRGKVRVLQVIFLLGVGLSLLIQEHLIAWAILVDVLALLEIRILWVAFDEFWSRLAIATCTLLLFQQSLAKWFFPHYFAPAACLVIFLQTRGLLYIWNWRTKPAPEPERPVSRAERRRIERQDKKNGVSQPSWNLRWVVYALPIACVISLVMNVEGRLNGTLHDVHGPVRQALLMDDWSLDRANIDHWLEQQTKAQLVFVRYSPRHNVNFEWVYNHPDIMHSHVMWARDLGIEHNKLLLNLVQDRTVWLIEADRVHPQLIPYEQAIQLPPAQPVGPGGAAPSPESNE